MNINKKAFTTVEVLAVVVILSILGTLIVPIVSEYLEKGKQEYNLELKNQLI